MSDNSTYYLTGIPMQHFSEYPIANQRLSECKSDSNSSSFSSQPETRTRSPFEAFGGFTEEEMMADESVMEEQVQIDLVSF